MTRTPLLFAGVLLAPMPVLAAELALSIEIPRLNVAEYHRPYVAAWLETPDGARATTLAVWYDTKMKDNGGTKWLKDLRQWWRRAGRTTSMPADGISGATRPAGTHALVVKGTGKALTGLNPGAYTLHVEAAREAGGRERLSIPITWGKAGGGSAKGTAELGLVKATVKP